MIAMIVFVLLVETLFLLIGAPTRRALGIKWLSTCPNRFKNIGIKKFEFVAKTQFL